MPNLGDRATCSACQRPIEWRGEYWAHLGEHQPRHIAEPVAFEPSNEPVELPIKPQRETDEREILGRLLAALSKERAAFDAMQVTIGMKVRWEIARNDTRALEAQAIEVLAKKREG